MNRNKKRSLSLSLIILLTSSAIFAVTINGGLWQFVKTLVASSGGSARISGGNVVVSHAIGQPNAQRMAGGIYEMVSGYYGGTSEGGVPQVSSITLASPAAVNNVGIGVKLNAVIQVTFSENMSSVTLASAFSVTELVNKNGVSTNTSVAFTATFDDDARTATLTPSSPWNPNTLYAMNISTVAMSYEGEPLLAGFTQRFQTLFDKNADNSFLDVNMATTRLSIPAGTLSKNGYVVIKTDPVSDPDKVDPSDILIANSKIVGHYGEFNKPITVREINAYDENGAPQEVTRTLLSLALPYDDADHDGMVDGTTPKVRYSSLAVWVLDETKKLWVKIPGGSANMQARAVTSAVPHLSTFALIGSADADVSATYAFPVPWTPYDFDSARYGTLADGITFAQLPSRGTIRIYTISGELVKTLDFSSGELTLRWDGTNDFGQRVASGVYLWQIAADENKKSGKLMIVW